MNRKSKKKEARRVIMLEERWKEAEERVPLAPFRYFQLIIPLYGLTIYSSFWGCAFI